MANLAAKRNVAVASMTPEAIERVKHGVLAAGLLKKEKILVFERNTSDDLRDKLVNVNELFGAYQLVMFSPTIEAGVGQSCMGILFYSFQFVFQTALCMYLAETAS